MGWLWSSPKESSIPTSPTPDPSPIDSPNQPPTSPSNTAPSETARPPDPELEAFLSSIRPSNSQTPKRPIPGFPTAQPSTSPTHSTTSPSPSSSDTITPAHLYPTHLSCRSAFDTAFYCASLGGQFTNIYRYGSLRRCSDEWAEFWWCVRTNRGFMSDEEKEATVLKRARDKEVARYREGGSSEDVWEPRRKMMKGAFQGDYWAAMEENERFEREREGGLVDRAVEREV